MLLKAPQGLSIRKIVRHVYNAHNSFFEAADIEDIKRFVTQYLSSRSKTRTSYIEHTGVRGVYKLNMQMHDKQQMALQFRDEKCADAEEESVIVEENSLDMFEGMY